MAPLPPCAGRGWLSLLLVVNVLPRLTLFLLFALYLSLVYSGQTFMTYQWTCSCWKRLRRAADELRHHAWHLAPTLALVPLHVHVRRGQALEPRSKLVGPVGALLSFFYAAPATTIAWHAAQLPPGF